jgi:MoxR-like ATPase
MTTNGVFVPQVNEDYFIDVEIKALFDCIASQSGMETQKAILIGPHGAGKTEMAVQYAALHKRPMLIMDCSNLKEARDWFGSKVIEDGKVVWRESQFDRAISAGGHVILLDEINRVHPGVMNSLIPLLDGRGFTYLDEKKGEIRVGPETVIFASANEGSAYTGTAAMDVALRDRFSRVIEVKYLAKEREVELLVRRTGVGKKDAERLVDIANAVRVKSQGVGSAFSQGFSTRQLLAAASDFTVMGVLGLKFTMENLFSSDGGTNSERAAVLQLIQGKFGGAEATAKSSLKG